MDIANYIREKATSDGFGVTKITPWNVDATLFVISCRGRESIIRVSGLEQVQNDDSMMKHLLDERYAEASLKTKLDEMH